MYAAKLHGVSGSAVLPVGGMSEAYLLDKLAEAKDAAGLTQL